MLVVHGIGEQNKNEHLQNVAKHLVNAAAVLFQKKFVNVELLPGADNNSDLSIIIDHTGEGKEFTCIDLHEVWWRDLCAKSESLDSNDILGVGSNVLWNERSIR